MAYGSPDPYYNPEAFGLTVLASGDIGGSYEFDMVVVWRHEDGRLFVGADSGCSCPSPFEDFGSLDELIEVNGLAEIVDFANKEWGWASNYEHEKVDSEIANIISSVMSAR